MIRYRVHVEIEYLLHLLNSFLSWRIWTRLRSKTVLVTSISSLRNKILPRQNCKKALPIAVKAVEYFIKEKTTPSWRREVSWIYHFGLTSQDINNTSVPLSLEDALNEIFYPQLDAWSLIWNRVPTDGWIISDAGSLRMASLLLHAWKGDHGLCLSSEEQPWRKLLKICRSAKFQEVQPEISMRIMWPPEYDWKAFADKFVGWSSDWSANSGRHKISNYDNLAAVFDGIKRINAVISSILRVISGCTSQWDISIRRSKPERWDHLQCRTKSNPIDFENAEATGIATYARASVAKLPISRMRETWPIRQSASMWAFLWLISKFLLKHNKGLGKLLLDKEVLSRDLEANWAVVAERHSDRFCREGYQRNLEALRHWRGNMHIASETIEDFIDTLNVDENVKTIKRSITPHNYTGL